MLIDPKSSSFFSSLSESNKKVERKLYEQENQNESLANPYDLDLIVNENLDSIPEGVQFPSGYSKCTCSCKVRTCAGGC